MDLNTQSLEILKLISDASESLCTNKLLFPKENGDRNTAFFMQKLNNGGGITELFNFWIIVVMLLLIRSSCVK